MIQKIKYSQSPEEEKLNAITHAFGIVMAFIFAFYYFQYVQKLELKLLAIVTFSLSKLFLYTSSTIYHATIDPERKYFWQVCDHIGIFFLIGGSYTPFVYLFIEEKLAFYFLSTMWSIILLGGALKIFFTGRYELLSVSLYLFLGWMVLFIYTPITMAMPKYIFTWITIGGASYTLGVGFYIWEKLKFHHTIWHLFVLFGTFCHSYALLLSISSSR